MKKILFSSILAIALLSSCTDKGGAKGSTDSMAAPQVAQVKYACPMHCEGDKTYDAPGPCPVCKMPMKEVK
ncbi:MAG TPA: heavy metal-binding domain-containing protein [Bacteroidia bacterium]|jgi:hypothetical protein|nr:heavy metal-binding domain-containing protein [Bacteroidia bacterium]